MVDKIFFFFHEVEKGFIGAPAPVDGEKYAWRRSMTMDLRIFQNDLDKTGRFVAFIRALDVKFPELTEDQMNDAIFLNKTVTDLIDFMGALQKHHYSSLWRLIKILDWDKENVTLHKLLAEYGILVILEQHDEANIPTIKDRVNSLIKKQLLIGNPPFDMPLFAADMRNLLYSINVEMWEKFRKDQKKNSLKS